MPIAASTAFVTAVIVCFLREMRFPREEVVHWGTRYYKDGSSPEEWQDRQTDVARVRDVRIVLLTLAFVCALPIPSLSLLCSFTAGFLLFLNCGKVSYKRERRIGTDDMVTDGDGADVYPPDFANWTDSQRYLYRMRRKVMIAKEAEKEVKSAVSEFPDETIQLERDLLKPGCSIDDTVVIPFKADTQVIDNFVEYLEQRANGK